MTTKSKISKKFVAVLTISAATLLAGMTYTYASENAATSPTFPSLVWSASYGNPGGLPSAVTGAATAGWKYGTAGTGAQSVPAVPGWPVVVAGQAGSISTSGDIAIVDATDISTAYLIVTVFITNMKPLALTYNSYCLPIRIYSADTFSGGAIAWSASPVVDSNSVDTANTYLTNTQGFESFKLATGPGKYYAITLDAGGAYYPYQTGAPGSATTPALYITAERTS